jgi:hypothetical protein
LPVVVAGTPAVFTLAVLGGGVRMPLVRVAETQPVPVVVTPAAPASVAEVRAPAPVAYVAPVHPRKQDRN